MIQYEPVRAVREPPQRRNRKSIRLQGYDYTQSGAYFVTICIQNRINLLGEIADDKMIFNDAGKMMETVWDAIPKYYQGIDIDAFQIMPSHIHGIIIVVGAGPRACPPYNNGQPRGDAPTDKTLSLSDVIHRLKTMTTKRYVDGVKQNGWPRFDHKLWQRNYYEHIIRNESELNRFRQYIADNPVNWRDDKNYINAPQQPR